MFRALIFLVLMSFATPAFSAMACDTTTEDQIKTTIAGEPDKLVVILEGDKLAHFLSEMVLRGYMIGSLPLVERIYVVDAGKLEGYTSDNVWLFLVQDRCLVGSIAASKPVIVSMIS